MGDEFGYTRAGKIQDNGFLRHTVGKVAVCSAELFPNPSPFLTLWHIYSCQSRSFCEGHRNRSLEKDYTPS